MSDPYAGMADYYAKKDAQDYKVLQQTKSYAKTATSSLYDRSATTCFLGKNLYPCIQQELHLTKVHDDAARAGR